MIKEDKDRIDQLLANCKKLNKEMEEMKRCVDFLNNEYRTNKRFFREEPGMVTVDDVIKTCFEFGWSSRLIFDCKEEQQ